MADSVTILQDVGTSGGKKTLAILGDGFVAGSDQTTYNNYVRDEMMRGVPERRGAIEISVYDATESLELDPVRSDSVRDARRRLARVATTGRLNVDEVRTVSRAGDRKAPPRE